MRDPAKRDDGAQFFHLGDRGREEIATCFYFLWRRFVFRRYAANRIGDAGIHQLKSVGGMRAILTTRKAEFSEGLVKQNPGIIAGKGPARAIGTLQSRREAYDQQPRAERPEGGHRCIEPGRLLVAPRRAKGSEPRAARAISPRLSVAADHCVPLFEGFVVVFGADRR